LQKSADAEGPHFQKNTDCAMTMSAVIDSRMAQASARPTVPSIARVDILTDLAAAEPVWRALEAKGGFSTPYQRYDFCRAWQNSAGRDEHVSPLLVVAVDAEQRPLLLLPLALTQSYSLRVAAFMGGKHTTFNMGLWDRDFAAVATRADLDGLLADLRQQAPADVLALTQQPLAWRGMANPLALWPHQPSVNGCPVLVMPPSAAAPDLISSSFRKRLRSKEKKLQALPGYRYAIATDDAEITHLLDWFFQVKPLRMAEQRLPNVFAEPGVEAFVREACMTRLTSGHRAIDIHALCCDEEVIALFAGVADDDRFSMMFNTYTLSPHAHWSPGLILMRHIIDHYAGRGYRALDLGIGSDDYKRLFCKDDEPIFDSFIALTARGRLAAMALAAINRGKHVVKHSPALLGVAQRLRQVLR
jgi:CelD/BcsL family acetyltransferase involved in cellulose biosynthesis